MPGKVDQLIRRLGDSGGPRFIRAYHGSPYDFDRFDASKIGTGEGVQAYAHGLYFSGAEPVADWYRRELSGPPDVFVGGERLPKDLGPLSYSSSPRENAIRLLTKMSQPYYDNPIQALREAALEAGDRFGGRDVQPIIDSLMRFKSDGVTFGPRPGKTYEVELGVPEESLLDWDAPIGQQPQPIRDNAALLEMVADEARNNALQARSQGRHDHWMNLANNPGDAPASLAMQAGNLRRPVGASRPPMNPRELADYLLKSGIPGVRYLDGSSRSAGTGTRNYVMFPGTEDSIRILRKYGLLAPMAAGALQEGE